MTPSTSPLSAKVLTVALLVGSPVLVLGQRLEQDRSHPPIDISGFYDSSHHWYDIKEEDRIIAPLPGQRRFASDDVKNIAENILLYQKLNGGWAKNYDMLAILTPEQSEALRNARGGQNTTFDNGATHAQIEYLARAWLKTKDARYADAATRGIDFVLSAQYPNGGWPQFFPDTSGYRKYITFNDGAMIGVMELFRGIVRKETRFAFVTGERRKNVESAFNRGVDCILRCQIKQGDALTAWCQQHHPADFHPESARTFELASVTGKESAEIVLFLMSIDRPKKEIVFAVEAAVQWFEQSKIFGVRVEEVQAETTQFIYHKSAIDRVVVNDPKAPPIWARFYELGSNRPLFCNRDGRPVNSLAEVDRERRTGYAWYAYDPEEVLKRYPAWKRTNRPSK